MGEIHVAFSRCMTPATTAKHFARVFHHEAAHNILGVGATRITAHQEAGYTAIGIFKACLSSKMRTRFCVLGRLVARMRASVARA
jgi:hypothetical protein